MFPLILDKLGIGATPPHRQSGSYGRSGGLDGDLIIGPALLDLVSYPFIVLRYLVSEFLASFYVSRGCDAVFSYI